MIDLRCRPIDTWNGPHAFPRRAATFDVRWDRQLRELARELDMLDARDVTIGLDLLPSQIRVDGWPKANASAPPPVVLTFDSKHGALRYQCDRWNHWRDNLRAITLVLQRQRLVNDAGVGTSDQVYRGFGALPPGGPIVMAAPMTYEQAISKLGLATAELGAREALREWRLDPHDAWRAAAKFFHPDAGGDADHFRELTEARDLIIKTRNL